MTSQQRPGRSTARNLRAGWQPADWQERHHPTEPVLVRVTATRARVLCRRRKQDARIWGALDAGQQRAAERIDAAYRIITGGLMTTTPSYGDPRGGVPTAVHDGSPDWPDQLIEDYRAWAAACERRRLPIGAVLDVVVHGLALSAVDATRYRGWARRVLGRALSLYGG